MIYNIIIINFTFTRKYHIYDNTKLFHVNLIIITAAKLYKNYKWGSSKNIFTQS